MNWQEAFLAQAKSDYAIFILLNASKTPMCHKLHYLQMASEKLAKSFMCDSKGNPPPPTHQAISQFLRHSKTNRQIRAKLGYQSNPTAFNVFIDSILPLADDIQRLAPSGAGFHRMNAEYPWSPAVNQVVPPCEHPFSEFPSTQIVRFQRLIHDLMRIAE